MNQAELLDQFVIEARECLEAIGQRLLQVEREPDNLELLNDLFRSVHTLKGNCGLFEFKPLEQVVHAGEDLLDRVRNRTLPYSAGLADALLDAMDYSGELIDQIERHGRIDDTAARRSGPVAATLRALLDVASVDLVPSPVPLAPAPAVPASAASAPPDWLAWLPAAAPGTVALRYLPEPECFFKGEDPWRLAGTAPGLQALRVSAQQPWPEGEALNEWDCYRCNLAIVLLSSAPRAELEAHFRCVPEQIECFEPAAPRANAAAVPAVPARAAVDPGAQVGPAVALLRRRAAVMWADQIALLARPGLAEGTVLAAARSLEGLLRAGGEQHAAADGNDAADRADGADLAAACAALRALPPGAAALRAWAQRHAGAVPDAGAAIVTPGASSLALPDSDFAAAAMAHPAQPARMAGDEGPPGAGPQRVLKVGQEKVDRLMDLIGEMVVAKNSLPYLAQRAEDVFGQRELAREIKTQYAVINRIAEDMQHAIMQVRMLPVGAVFQRFGRLVRDISKKLGKEVQMVIEGEDTEADKNVIEPLADPLIHILRNSLDHGIELPEARRAAGKPTLGTIRIRARQESDRVIIEIADDGAGVNAARVRAKAVERGLIPADRAATLSDADAVQLVFLPGFSTADAISDLSGRGVGMDVVRTAVERIHGAVALSSRAGQGTTITLSLPLSMAVTHVMVIECAGRRFGLPMDLISETVRVHEGDIHHFKAARTTVLRGRIVPLRPLAELLALDAPPERNADGEYAVLVLRLPGGNVGLLVDQFHGASDIILKPLEGVLAGLTGFAGTALMGDGGVLMVLNPKELL